MSAPNRSQVAGIVCRERCNPARPNAMSALRGRRIVLGVSGGIAAYKAAEVCRRLVGDGAHVVPVLTAGALRMVGETTFSALASEPAVTSLWNDPSSAIPHTALGQRADAVVVCPATARLISDLRTGRSGDVLTATLLATRAPVIVAPAMHTEMWEQPSVQENIAVLAGRGVTIVGPVEGRLAGGDIGSGRMAEPAEIVAAVEAVLTPQDLIGRRVLVTLRRDPRADRRGALRGQSLVREAGLGCGGGGRGPRRRGCPRNHRTRACSRGGSGGVGRDGRGNGRRGGARGARR